MTTYVRQEVRRPAMPPSHRGSRRPLLWLGTPLLALALWPGASSAAPVVTVESKSVAPLSDYQLRVTVSGADSLAALRLLLEYGPLRNVARAAPVLLGDLEDRRLRSRPLAAFPDTSGSLDVAWISALGVNGADSLFVLFFHGRGDPGTADTVRIDVLESADLGWQEVSAEGVDGIVTFSGTVAVGEIGAVPSALKLSLSRSVTETPAFFLSLPERSHLELEIFDVQGRRLRSLWSGPAGPGSLRVVWDTRNDAGSAVASGIFLCRASAGTEVAVARFVVVR